MELNASDLNEKKFLVAGLQGTGKTYLVKRLARFFTNVAVYTPHPDEWKASAVVVFDMDDFVEDFSTVTKLLKKFKTRFDCLIIDEADMLFETQFDVEKTLNDIIINHRHYGLSVMFSTRRPQNIPAKIYNQFENLMLFSIEAPHVRDLLNRYYEGLGDMVSNLNYGSHNFVFKKIGEAPRVVKI